MFDLNNNTSVAISLVFPVTGSHAWDLTEGWVNALERLGILNRVFRARAAWGAKQLEEDDGLLDYLAGGPDDYLLLLGLDWHSQPLHYGLIGEMLRKRRHRNISLIWEDYASDHAQASGLKERMVDAWRRSASIPFVTFTNHHANIRELKGKLQGGAIEFLPFGVDEERYLSAEKPFHSKKANIYFSGKVSDWSTQQDGGPYARRRQVIEALQKSISSLEVQTGLLSEKEYVEGLSANRICINLPSFSRSPTLRNYEALMAGSALVTWRPPADHPNDLKDYPNVFWYDWEDPQSAVEQAGKVLAMTEDEIEECCRTGGEMARSQCTLLQRAIRMRDFLQSHKYRIQGIGKESPQVVVVDGVFFQIAHNGIAYVWDSIIEKLIHRIGRENLVLINRAGSLFKNYGCREIHTDRFDWDTSPQDAREQTHALLLAHGISDCIFASSYYTVSKYARNVQIIHDMIPEILGGDEPVWKHKDYSIEKSQAILCVSGSTYWDLIACHPAVWPRTHIALNGMPLAHIEASKIPGGISALDPRLSRATDPSVFKVLYVGGRVGWKGYKNGITLIRAFRTFSWTVGGDYPARLVFVSGNTHPENQICKELDGLDVEFVSADDRELSRLRDCCECFVYPSFLEGFGLPVIEALYAGMPVIASGVPPIIEASDTHKVLHFNPSRPEQLSWHLTQVYQQQRASSCHERSDEIAKTKEKIERSSHERWEHFADLIIGSGQKNEEVGSRPYHDTLSSFLHAAGTNFRCKQNLSRRAIEAAWR
jgi:glycosyltransferase involved in cell wall biosynthesis